MYHLIAVFSTVSPPALDKTCARGVRSLSVWGLPLTEPLIRRRVRELTTRISRLYRQVLSASRVLLMRGPSRPT